MNFKPNGSKLSNIWKKCKNSTILPVIQIEKKPKNL